MVAADEAGKTRAKHGRTKHEDAKQRGKQERAKARQEISKGQVRVRVTYLMSGTYAVSAITLICWLLWKESYDLALGVFSGVASTTATITAFWFGSRGSKRARAVEKVRRLAPTAPSPEA